MSNKQENKVDREFINERLIKDVAKGGGIAFIFTIIGKVITFCLHIVLTRFLGASLYGLYALGLSVLRIARTIGTLGFKQGIVRFSSKYWGEGDKPRIKGTIVCGLTITLVFSIALGVLLFTLSGAISQKFFHKPELTWVIKIFSLSLPFYVFIWISTSFLRAFRRIDLQQGLEKFLQPLLNLILIFFAFLIGVKLYGAIFGFLTSVLITAILSFFWIKRLFPDLVSRLKPHFEYKNLLNFSIPLFLAGFSFTLISQVDKIMLGYFRRSSDVGIYNVAFIVAFNISIFATSLNAIFFPMIGFFYRKGTLRKLEDLFKISVKWILMLSLPIVTILVLFSKEIMRLFGAEFVSGWVIFIVLTFSYLADCTVYLGRSVLMVMEKQYLILFNAVILIVLNLFLNVLLISKYGGLGAAVATGISLIIFDLLAIIELKFLYKITPFKKQCFKPLLSAVAAGIFGIFCKGLTGDFFHWIFILLAVIIVYVFALYLAGFDDEDRFVLQTLRKKIGLI